MIDVVCVGILVADVLAKPVDAVPGKGLLGLVDAIELFSGGNAMTCAVNLKKLGVQSAVAGKIGTDAFGVFLERKLIDSGVNIDSLARDAAVQTAASVVLSGTDGERTFLHCTGANGTFSIRDVNWDVIAQAKTVFVTGTFLLDTFDGDETTAFLQRCKDMGKTTALDVCWDSKGNWGALLESAYPYIDLFLPSIAEAERLAGKSNTADMADYFLARGVKKVVIKVGKDGAYGKEAGGAGFTVPTYQNIPVIDTTGAGDSFCSGFLAAYTRGESFQACIQFANAVGTHCVMAKGAVTGIKSYAEITKFMEENKCS